MKSKIQNIILAFLMVFAVAQPLVAEAQTNGGFVICGTRDQDVKGSPEVEGKCKISDLVKMVYISVNYLIGMAGLVAIAFVVWGGLLMLTSNGNPARIKDGKDTIFNAILGLVLTMLAYLIIGYVAALVFPSDINNPLETMINLLGVQ